MLHQSLNKSLPPNHQDKRGRIVDGSVTNQITGSLGSKDKKRAGVSSEIRKSKNIQQLVFAGGHPPNY